MPTPVESKAVAERVADRAVLDSTTLLSSLKGSPESVRAGLLEVVPELISAYGLGVASLAADLYEDQREMVGVAIPYAAETVVVDRTVQIRRGIAWASEPLFTDDWDSSLARLTEIVTPETMRPYRDTILTNRKRDPASVGWRRITSAGACGFCQMLADKGAIYRQATARFAAHSSCKCTAAPVFEGETGPEASALQYVASKRRRTEAEKADIRWWVNAYEQNPSWYREFLASQQG